jgi:hypothetical protein
VDIEDFYDENEARRESAEYEFGTEWTSPSGALYELSWVEATGELYLMCGPEAAIVVEPMFGDAVEYDEPTSALEVRVIATIKSLDDVERVLDGWQDAMVVPGSLDWIASKIDEAGYSPS